MIKTLVVNDTEEWWQLISRILPPKEYELVYAANILRAKNFLETEVFHLLILDAFVPDLDNWWSFYSLIRKNLRLTNMRVVVTFPKMTPLAEQEWNNQLKNLLDNGDNFINIPFSAQELISVLSKVLK